MQTDDRNQRVTALVEGYLRGGTRLDDYLTQVDGDLRDEVRAQCEDAAFIGQFFGSISAPPRTPERPRAIGGCELIELLGAGAMGEVHRARQIELDRPVAVKLVRGDVSHRDDYRERFRQEAHVLASLDHPGIVKVLSYGEEHGWRYFVMELVTGRDLGDLLPDLQAAFDREAPRAGDRVARIVAGLLETLAYAHGRGVVHRDLKPSNVMLDADDHPHLVDFGLSKALEGDPPGWQVRTVPGLLLGTPAYWSPEVAARQPFVRESPDIWAVGVMLFQMLTGQLPYPDASTERLLTSLASPANQDPRTLSPRVPTPLAAICVKALAPDPTERYASAQEFATDLRRFLARQPVHAEARQPITRALRHLWRYRRRYALLLAGAAATVAVWLAAAFVSSRREVRAAAAGVIEAVQSTDLTLPALAAQANKARELLAGGLLGTGQAAALAASLRKIEARAQRDQVAGLEDIRRGAGSPLGTPRPEVAAPSPVRQMVGLQRASAAAMVLAEPADGARLLESGFPRLRIEHPIGRGATAVRIDSVDPITGRPVMAVADGTTPFEQPLPPGDYRVVLGDGSAFAECLRTLGPPGTIVVTPALVATGTSLVDMCTVPAGTAVIGQDTPDAYIYAQQTVTHPAFFIDRTEVTCGAYNNFCVATGTEPPAKWGGAFDPAWQDLPVVGVSAADATAFAEWAGKRLPTWTEWQIAARGPAGALYPWGDDPAPLAMLPSVGGDPDAPWHTAVRAVGTLPLDTSWCGAQDMLGNIDEWTSTPYVAQFQGMPFPVYPWRLRGGASWESKRNRYAALDVVSPGQPEWFGSGFRCAKSANP